MTQRERHTPDGGAAAPPVPPPANGEGRGPGADLGRVWDDIFLAATPARRQQLLDLAGRQGVLYAHQMPPSGNGPGRRSLLPGLLNGQFADLAPLHPAAVECPDAGLDDAQRDAVARALHTPDLCLIQGYPGSGKSRTAAAVVAAAAARGERVLLLAPTAAAVDGVLERLAGRDDVCAARCLSAGERPEALPPSLRRLIFEERLRAFRDETAPAAKRAADEAKARCERHRLEEGAWATLNDLARRREALAEEDRRLADAADRIEAEVAAVTDEAAPFRLACTDRRAVRDEALARIDARLAALRAETAKVRGEQQAAADEAGRLRPLAEALRVGHWWTKAWWCARREGDLSRRVEELDRRLEELQGASERLARESEERTAERVQVEARFQEETAELHRGEAERRRAECAERRADLSRERQALEDQAATVYRGLSEGGRPPPLSVAAVRDGLDAWRRALEQDERQAESAAQWAEAVEAALATLPERMADCVNVVGGATSALAADPRFGDLPCPPILFDMLVLEESHLVTESEFLAAARRARRWVLIGEPTDEEPPPVAPSRGGREGRGTTRPLRPSALRPGFFQRLWRLLHADPRSLPYAWSHRDGRLVCRLRPAPPGEERWVVSERLADRPEIELIFAAPPRTAPRLLEVVFPGATTIHEAKTFIFRELSELPVQARGAGFRWCDDAGRLTLDLSDGAVADPVAVSLAEGVCERVRATAAGAGWHTCSLEFDRAAGWTRERAEAWVEEHLRTRCLGRTVPLTTPHRSRPVLARFLSGLLFDGAFQPRREEEGLAVEFVAVPPLDEAPARRTEPEIHGRHGGTAVAPRLRSLRGGAGLEIDLSEPRRLDPLPADLRAALPRQGLVNLFEAKAVVRKLEALAADPAFRAAAEEWAHRDGCGSGCTSATCQTSAVPCAGRRPAVAVMALYPAQAELIRLLAAQSPALTAAPAAVEIGTPEAFRCRECFTALVSLTRSHAHRAVPFGADPSWFPTALTRAADRVVLFGDAGTLARRCQWNGAIDHLDEAAGERERGCIDRIVAYLHGRGPHPTTFGLDESGRV